MIFYILHFIVAVVATIAFAIIFEAPKKEYCLCGLSGGIGWSVYEILHVNGMHLVAATLIATIALTVFSRVLAVIRRQPATVYLIAGIFPLVPGAGIYYTSYYLISQDMEMFSSKGIETFEVAGAIVIGIIFAMAIPQQWLNQLHRFRKKGDGRHGYVHRKTERYY